MTERVNPDVAPAHHFGFAVGYTPRPEPRRCRVCLSELEPSRVTDVCALHEATRKEGGW